LVSGFVLAAVFGAAVAISGIDRAAAAGTTVKVFADYYSTDDAWFADLDALEAWMKPRRLHALRLDACGAASTKRLLAVVERLHRAYTDNLEIRALSDGDSGCPQAATESALRAADSMYPSRPIATAAACSPSRASFSAVTLQAG
jgi:hypothetical protein